MKKDTYRVYISGQITGLDGEDALRGFEQAELQAYNMLLKSPAREGFNNLETVNPMLLEHKSESTWEDFMEKDIAELLRCNAIYLMKNWGKSRGARIERAIALELGLHIFYQD